jgi:hypothetical protein
VRSLAGAGMVHLWISIKKLAVWNLVAAEILISVLPEKMSWAHSPPSQSRIYVKENALNTLYNYVKRTTAINLRFEVHKMQIKQVARHKIFLNLGF